MEYVGPSVQCSVCSVQCGVCIVQCEVVTPHSLLCIIVLYCVECSAHCEAEAAGFLNDFPTAKPECKIQGKYKD